jgi:hypothetical protein
MYISTAFLTGLIVVGMLLIRPEHPWVGRGAVLPLALIVVVGSLPYRKGVAVALEYLVERKMEDPTAPDRADP